MQEQNKDIYDQKLDEKVIEVQACQNEKGLKSCMACELFFDCALRKEYVKKVYESMSKGETGGFEF